MPGRSAGASNRPRLRWLAGGAALAAAGVTGAMLLAMTPAGAANTVNAQLSLSGVATSDSVAGGAEIGVHPGDTVNFKASALPTVGLEKIPSLGPVLENVLNGLLGQYQVVVSFGASFPGGAQTVTLGGPTSGKCAGAATKSFTFPAKGTYSFTWKVQYVLPLLLGCTKSGLSDTNLNLLAKAGVKLNATNSWVGQVVVADNPPKGELSLQLPSLSVSPNIAGHQLPTLGVPGLTLGGAQLPLPNLNTKPGGATAKTGKQATGSGTADLGTVIPVPAEVVPRGDNAAVFSTGGFIGNELPKAPAQLGDATAVQPITSGNAASTGKVATTTKPPQQSTGKDKTIDLASSTKAPTGQLSVVLAILAIIALTLVAATYARLYLLRKP